MASDIWLSTVLKSYLVVLVAQKPMATSQLYGLCLIRHIQEVIGLVECEPHNSVLCSM